MRLGPQLDQAEEGPKVGADLQMLVRMRMCDWLGEQGEGLWECGLKDQGHVCATIEIAEVTYFPQMAPRSSDLWEQWCSAA